MSEDLGKEVSKDMLDVFLKKWFVLNISNQYMFRMFHKEIISHQLIQDIQDLLKKEFGSIDMVKMDYDESSDKSYEYFLENNKNN